MKKDELMELVEEQKQEINKLKLNIDDLRDKLIDYENIKELNTRLQTELYLSKENEKVNNITITHLEDKLRIYETTFNALTGGNNDC